MQETTHVEARNYTYGIKRLNLKKLIVASVFIRWNLKNKGDKLWMQNHHATPEIQSLSYSNSWSDRRYVFGFVINSCTYLWGLTYIFYICLKGNLFSSFYAAELKCNFLKEVRKK